MGQLAFWFDASTCIGCKACEIACKEKNDLPAGVRWRQVWDYGEGEWTVNEGGGYVSHENTFTYYVSATCMHCEEAPCIPVCEPGSLYKRESDGVVLNNLADCTGCRLCEPACPYDALYFDRQSGLVTKCDFCADSLEIDETPACIHICPQRCLDYGELDELREKYGDLSAIEPIPDAKEIGPAFVVVPHKDSVMSGEGKGRILNRLENIKTSHARVSTRTEIKYPDDLSGEVNYLDFFAGEMALFGLLSRALLSYADRPWLQSLADNSVFAEVPFAIERPDIVAGQMVLRAWCESYQGGMSDEQFEALNTDYTQLFTTTFGQCFAPPWESVYCNENQLLFQEQTESVRKWYKKYGLESAWVYKEPDDHIGLELSFLAHLASLGYSSAKNNATSEMNAVLDAQRKFLSEHTLVWVHHWCDRTISMARTDFYRGVGLLVRGALSEISAVLKLKIANKLHIPYERGAGAKLAKKTGSVFQ